MGSTMSETASAPTMTDPTPISPSAPPPPQHTGLRRLLWIVGAAVAAIAFVLVLVPWLHRAWTTESTDDAYVAGHSTVVAARVAGQVTRVLVDDNNRVSRGTLLVELDKEPFEIAVRLQQAMVDSATSDLSVVHDQLRGNVAQARANRFQLERAMEDVRNQLALLRSRVAEIKVAQANQVLAKADFARGEALIKTAAISAQQFDQFRAALDVAKNKVVAAESAVQQTRASLGLPVDIEDPLDVPANLDQNFSAVRQALATMIASIAPLGVFPEHYNVTPKEIIAEFYRRDPEGNLDRIYEKLVREAPAIKQARAKLDQAKADLDQAKLNLSWCVVKAEIDGVVTRRNVNPGDNVQAGQGLMAVRSLTDIWIDANFKETQLSQIRIGQRAEINVDLYGRKEVFKGRVTGFAMGTGSTLSLLPAQNATGNFVKVVQRLPVRIELTDYDPERAPLFVGLSVEPYVFIKEAPTGPDAGKMLQPPMAVPAIPARAD